MPKNDKEETFTVTLCGDGIEIKREVSASKLALVMSVIMGSEPTEKMTMQTSEKIGTAGPTKVSLREFLDDAKATTKPDQIVAIGQYIIVHEGKDTFSRDEIKARFQSARERLPSNLPRDFSTAISKGMIAEDHSNAGQYYVTKKGAQSIEQRFGAPK